MLANSRCVEPREMADGFKSSSGRAPAGAPRLRFKIGDRVECNTAEGWLPGVVNQTWYREEGWPPGQFAPYQIELDVDMSIYAPADDNAIIRREGAAPWHEKLGEQMRRADIASLYPERCLHKDLFDPASIDAWFVPELRAALATFRRTRDARDVDVGAIPGLRLEAPGVVSFACLEPALCDRLLDEAKHYTASGLPQRAPNTMNNYGVVLNEVGLRPTFDAVLRDYTHALGAAFFGDAPPATVHGEESFLENWGGATLSDHHTFVVRYRPDEDRHLDMHVDECDVTFNFGLSRPDGFGGSDLAFCGMFGSPDHRKHLHTYAHVQGRCVLHSGKRRHGALDIESGERASLIMWTKSPAFRRTDAYKRRWGREAEIRPERGEPDRVCLSYTHDRDFERLRRKLGDATGNAPPE